MPEEKVAAPKRATKKAVAVAETTKPKKAATAPAKAPAAVAAVAEASKPKKAAGTAPAKTAAKAVSNAPAAAKATTAKPAGLAKKKAPAGNKLVDKPAAPSAEERQRWIATAAYHRAEKRGFATGYEVQDWFDAVAEIDALVGKA